MIVNVLYIRITAAEATPSKAKLALAKLALALLPAAGAPRSVAWTVFGSVMCISPLLSALSLSLSVLSFRLHRSFVGRNSRPLAHTIARPLAYESSGEAAREAGKKEGRRVLKL